MGSFAKENEASRVVMIGSQNLGYIIWNYKLIEKHKKWELKAFLVVRWKKRIICKFQFFDGVSAIIQLLEFEN